MTASSPSQKVITFNYTLKDSKGEVLDQSSEGPMSFLTGVGQIIPRLEQELISMLIGQKKTVSLVAVDAYGVPDPKMVMEVPKKELSHIQVEVGTPLELNLGDMVKFVRVTKITDDTITLDGNHPLAGQDLVFDVEVLNQRAATQDEMAHGHAHGPGGHHH